MAALRNADSHLTKKLRLLPALSVLLFLLACSMADYGRLLSSNEVTSTFKAYEIQDDYEYYYYGWLGEPDAVLGLKKGYTIQSDLWKKVNFSKTSMQILVDRVGRNTTSRNGYHVLDPQGNRIGIYFSTGGTATIRMAGATEIAWITPQIRKTNDMRGSER